MADSLCTPLVACDGLDGRVVLRRMVYGPSLFEDLLPLQFGDFSLLGGALRPSIDIQFQVQWIPKELCTGPVSSIMSLAPTETVTAAIRTTRRDSFSQLMSDAADSSTVRTHSQREFTRDFHQGPPAGGGIGGLVGGALSGVGGAQPGGLLGGVLGLGRLRGSDVIDLAPITVAGFGSFFSDLGSLVTGIGKAVIGGPAAIIGSALGDAVGGAIAGTIGGGGRAATPGSPIIDTHERVRELIDAVERRESQSHLRQNVVSNSTETEEFLTRTFANPYRDRSLQLRFLPVYRHFEVVTTLFRVVPGIALIATTADPQTQTHALAAGAFMRDSGARLARSEADAATAAGPLVSTATATRAVMAWTQLGHDDDAVRRPLAEALIRNAEAGERADGTFIEQGLRWEQAEVRADAIHVPLAPADVASKAWNLDPEAGRRLADHLGMLAPGRLDLLIPTITRQNIHVFAGTHVEAVPGDCILPGLVSDALSVNDVD